MIRFLLAIVAGCCLGLETVSADVPPFELAKQYSADMTVTAKDQVMTNKIFNDNGKIRTEMNTRGMQMVSIIRPDQQKMYSVMVNQKMVMVMPYDPSKVPMSPTSAGDGKFELVGPETIGGAACTKYKVTNKEGKMFFMWIDGAKKVPVQMTSEDGSFSILWKNVQLGPQDAALFEPPADYQKMEMQSPPAH